MIDRKELQDITREAGGEVMRIYKKGFLVSTKKDNSPVTGADMAANKIICERLSFYGWPIVSEESKEPDLKNKKSFLWLVDPLDGTRDFIQKTGEFSVMVALIKAGELVMAAIYWPVNDEYFFAERGKGAVLNKGKTEISLQVSRVEKWNGVTVVNSRNHPEEMWNKESFLGVKKIKHRGSAGLKGAMIAKGEADVYINTSDKARQWDIGAAALLVEEAGGTVTDCWGNRLVFGTRGARLKNGYVISNGLVHDMALRKIKQYLC